MQATDALRQADAGDAMAVRGGFGYIEESGNARLGSIWQGRSNIVVHDVLRPSLRHATLARVLCCSGHRQPSPGMGYKRPMPDDDQIHIPPSFEAVHADARGRLTLRRDEFRLRYELSEDMAQMLVEHSQALHHDQGVAEGDILRRTAAGLASPDAGFSPAEAAWVVTRLAELLGWPWAALPVAVPSAQARPQRR